MGAKSHAAVREPEHERDIPTVCVPSRPPVEVDFHGALYEALIEGLLAFYEAGDTFQMPYGTYTRDELVAEFREFLEREPPSSGTRRRYPDDDDTSA